MSPIELSWTAKKNDENKIKDWANIDRNSSLSVELTFVRSFLAVYGET